MKHIQSALLILCLALTARCQVVERWFAETSRPKSQSVIYYHGETIKFNPTVTVYGNAAEFNDSTVVKLWYQTLDMGAAWWSIDGRTNGAPGQLEVTFAPTNDFGHSKYTFYIGATTHGARVYRVLGTMELRPSPGFIPAQAVKPSVLGDFAEELAPLVWPYVFDMLPPFELPGAALAVSQSLARVIADLPTGGGGTTTNVFPAIEANTDAIEVLATQHISRVWSTATNYMDGDGVMWEVQPSYGWRIVASNLTDDAGHVLNGSWDFADFAWPLTYPMIHHYACPLADGWIVDHAYYEGWYWTIRYTIQNTGVVRAKTTSTNAVFVECKPLAFNTEYQSGSAHVERVVVGLTTNSVPVDRMATTGAVANAIAQLDLDSLISTQTLATVVSAGNHTATNVPSIDDEAVVSVRAEETERIALYGSATVRPGVEAYSTYAPALIARSATGPGALLIQGPVSNSVAAEISGELLISSEPTANEGAGQPGAIRLGGRAITSWDEIEAQIDQSDINALNAWGRRLPDGTPNAASDTAVVINTPMIIASGLGFETSGNYAVCITSGAEMQVVTNGGWVCIKPSTWTDGIGFRTISMTVPAIANSFNVVNGGKTNGYAQIKFAYTAGETNAPPVSYSTDLLTWAFAPEQQATQDGATWTVTVAADQPRMYFKGEGRTGSADRIYSAYPHTFDQGIAVGALSPVVYDAVITVEHGGKTYRIPAQEVQ